MTEHIVAAGIVLRPATADDRARLLELVKEGVGRAAYRELPSYFVRMAVGGRADEESRGVVALRDHAIVGCVVFGAVAGAIGTGRIHFIAVAADARQLGIGRQLCEIAMADLTKRGARSVVVELPDDETVLASNQLFRRCGFTEAARVPDYYRDGVALVVLHRAILAAH